MDFERLDINQPNDKDDHRPASVAAHVDIKQHAPNFRSLISPTSSDEEVAAILAGISHEQYNPFHKVLLPSKGIYYGWPNGYAEVRALDQEADKILSTEQLIRSGQAIDMILRNFTRLPGGMDVLDLINGDRIYLLYYLRGYSHGNKYEFVATCGSCERSSPYVYDLNQLQETVLWGDESLGPEPFKIVLPVYSEAVAREVYVHVRWPRGRDTQQVVAQMRLKNKITAGVATASNRRGKKRLDQADAPKAVSDAVTDNLENLIVDFNGNADRMIIKQCVEKMHQTDTAAIRKWMNDNIPGPDTSVELKCSSCGEGMEIPLPITESFFRSTQ